MIDFIKEQQKNFKDKILSFLDDEINKDKKQLKNSFDDGGKNYFYGALDTLVYIKQYIKDL